MNGSARSILDGAVGSALTPAQRDVVAELVDRCPSLRRDLARATAPDPLRPAAIEAPPTDVPTAVDPEGGSIVVASEALAAAADDLELVFLLGHALHRAANHRGSDELRARLASLGHRIARNRPMHSVGHPHRDYSAVVNGFIDAHEFDEARAHIAGWNAYVGFLRSAIGDLTVSDLARTPRADDVLQGSRLAARVRAGFDLERDLTLAPTPRNLESMLRIRVRRPPELARLGPAGMSDHANLSGAVVVGFVCRAHRAHHPRQDSTRGSAVGIDFTTHGLRPTLLMENGLDLGPDRSAVPYLDVRSDGRIRGHFRHTSPRAELDPFERRTRPERPVAQTNAAHDRASRASSRGTSGYGTVRPRTAKPRRDAPER